jgi:hypothetical protein
MSLYTASTWAALGDGDGLMFGSGAWRQIGVYLDRHLVFPLLEFLQVKGVHPEAEILEAKIELLQKTNMVDFAMDIYKSLHATEQVHLPAHIPCTMRGWVLSSGGAREHGGLFVCLVSAATWVG